MARAYQAKGKAFRPQLGLITADVGRARVVQLQPSNLEHGFEFGFGSKCIFVHRV